MELICKKDEHHFYYQYWKDLSQQYSYSHSVVLPKATYSPWNGDEQFLRIYDIAKENTLVDIYRCYELWKLVQQTNKLPGKLIEVGVWKGGTGTIIAGAAQGATVFLCDTFSGVVKAGEKDNQYVGGEHADTSVNIVESLFSKVGLSNYSILQGIFPEETGAVPGDEQIRFCHIDVDVYNSARDIFNWVMQRLVTGGIIVFDDYGFAACEGITGLVNELGQDDRLHQIHNINGHGILIKIK